MWKGPHVALQCVAAAAIKELITKFRNAHSWHSASSTGCFTQT